MPNPTLITRIATRQEAIGTSALEGTFANLTDLLTAEDAEIAGDSDRFGVPPNVREVMNYTRAADRGYSWVQDRPIGLQMLSALQAIIVRGTEADGSEAGAPPYATGLHWREQPARYRRSLYSPPGSACSPSLRRLGEMGGKR